jgi:hypothetical protein
MLAGDYEGVDIIRDDSGLGTIDAGFTDFERTIPRSVYPKMVVPRNTYVAGPRKNKRSANEMLPDPDQSPAAQSKPGGDAKRPRLQSNHYTLGGRGGRGKTWFGNNWKGGRGGWGGNRGRDGRKN